MKYYNVRFITESHPWPQDQVLKSSLFLPYFLYRNYLSITVSKLDRTGNVCIWLWTWRHFQIWSSNLVFKSGQRNRSCKHINNERLQENLIQDSWLWFILPQRWSAWQFHCGAYHMSNFFICSLAPSKNHQEPSKLRNTKTGTFNTGNPWTINQTVN